MLRRILAILGFTRPPQKQTSTSNLQTHPLIVARSFQKLLAEGRGPAISDIELLQYPKHQIDDALCWVADHEADPARAENWRMMQVFLMDFVTIDPADKELVVKINNRFKCRELSQEPSELEGLIAGKYLMKAHGEWTTEFQSTFEQRLSELLVGE